MRDLRIAAPAKIDRNQRPRPSTQSTKNWIFGNRLESRPGASGFRTQRPKCPAAGKIRVANRAIERGDQEFAVLAPFQPRGRNDPLGEHAARPVRVVWMGEIAPTTSQIVPR